MTTAATADSILIVTGDTVTNAILVPAGAIISGDGARVTWVDGLDAPEGARFAAAPEGVGIGWTLVDGAWVPPADEADA